MSYLKNILDLLVADPSLAPIGNITFCNIAVKKIAVAMGYHDFGKQDLANDMIDLMSRDWIPANGHQACSHALHGGFSVAGIKQHKHGHVAVIYPTQMQKSPSLGIEVPSVANIGKVNKISKVTEFFPVKLGEPKYFLWPGIA